MKSFTTLARLAVLASTLAAANVYADPMPFTSALVSTDPTQMGRLSRNGIPQDFDGTEAYPGILAGTEGLTYHYHAYTINVGLTPFVTVNFDSLSTNTFVSAYQSAYFVTNRGATWLGDPGTSGNYFGTDPLQFSFIAALNSQVVLIVNETTPNAGLNAPFTFIVQGFTDRDFDGGVDLAVTSGGTVIPEPSTVALLFAPLAGIVAMKGRRRRKVAEAA